MQARESKIYFCYFVLLYKNVQTYKSSGKQSSEASWGRQIEQSKSDSSSGGGWQQRRLAAAAAGGKREGQQRQRQRHWQAAAAAAVGMGCGKEGASKQSNRTPTTRQPPMNPPSLLSATHASYAHSCGRPTCTGAVEPSRAGPGQLAIEPAFAQQAQPAHPHFSVAPSNDPTLGRILLAETHSAILIAPYMLLQTATPCSFREPSLFVGGCDVFTSEGATIHSRHVFFTRTNAWREEARHDA